MYSCVLIILFGFSLVDKFFEFYINWFVCVLFDNGYCLFLVMLKLLILGYIFVVIDGEIEGKCVELDSVGCYKVWILDEESGLFKGKVSYVVCKMEFYGGGDGYGFYFMLLIGMEVLFGFLYGDLDRLVIFGVVFNGE